MGCCLSSGPAQILEYTDGGEEEYRKQFIEDEILGEGEFGTVYLVHEVAIREASRHGKRPPLKMKTVIDKSNEVREADCSSLACKTLRKGFQFKNNELYAPMDPEILKREVEILRKLDGKAFNLAVYTVFESPKIIYLITELCSGGDMIQYLARRESDLRLHEVSRISYQLLSAVDHCAKCDIINRDIKPENIMFSTPADNSPLRLIDFGGGTDKVVDGFHTTFAGTPFYNSPEMFQESYTQKTDVFSSGVCLYVCVAGYPADKLQTAFNIIHKIVDKEQNLKALPGMPDMPESYFKMLKDMLEYKQKKRKTAGQILASSDFVRFHTQAPSVHNANIAGSVGRHNMFLDYQKFERSLTTLLATMLTKSELSLFVKSIDHEIEQQQQVAKSENIEMSAEEFLNGGLPSAEAAPKEEAKEEPAVVQNLDIITIKRVMEMMKESGFDQV